MNDTKENIIETHQNLKQGHPNKIGSKAKLEPKIK